jgi:spermidine synthase
VEGFRLDLWFSEYHSENVRFSIRVDKQLYSGQSDFQRIDVFSSPEFGRFLILDGYMMFTEKDEFIYHEMITHVPMAVHPQVERVLLIGAGDGGAARELTRYSAVEHIDIVEIDPQVVEVCREFFPDMTKSFNDSRVHIHYEDGLRYIRRVNDEYDLIVVDSTDPFGPGEGLFTKEFYGNCFKALKEDGIMVNQHESAFYEGDAQAVKRAHKRIVQSFSHCLAYQAHIPTYPSGHWLFGFSTKKYHPLRDFKGAAWKALGLKTRYYNTQLHVGAFALPNYVEDILKEAERR